MAPTSRLTGPLRSQDRPGIGRGGPSADGLRVFVGRPDASGRHPRTAIAVPSTAACENRGATERGERIRQAVTKHGRYSQAAKAQGQYFRRLLKECRELLKRIPARKRISESEHNDSTDRVGIAPGAVTEPTTL